MGAFPTLTGFGVALRPLRREDAPALAQLATPAVVQFLSDSLASEEEMCGYVERALVDGATQAYAVESGGEVVGSTRLFRIDMPNRGAEIGHTFYAERVWRTHVNTASKLFLLTYAFETLDLIRVFFQTDEINARSRAAIERIGAKQEGIFRNNRICWNGRVRDSVFFSILVEEWREVKVRLQARLSATKQV